MIRNPQEAAYKMSSADIAILVMLSVAPTICMLGIAFLGRWVLT